MKTSKYYLMDESGNKCIRISFDEFLYLLKMHCVTDFFEFGDAGLYSTCTWTLDNGSVIMREDGEHHHYFEEGEYR